MINGPFDVNIAVNDLYEAIGTFQALQGLKAEPHEEGDFSFTGLKGAGFDFDGSLTAFPSSENEENPVGRFLAKRGRVCYSSP
ncbi:MAG: hypothetical protein SWK76_17510 [Actinomycetota bacterium]|nr:hypothetical protein [Actinomycetota bacterium]